MAFLEDCVSFRVKDLVIKMCSINRDSVSAMISGFVWSIRYLSSNFLSTTEWQFIGKILRPFHRVNFWTGSIYFTSELASLTSKKKDRYKKPVQIHCSESNTQQCKTVHQQAAPPTRLVYTFPARCL